MINWILLLILAVVTVGFVGMAILYFRCVDRCQLEEEEYDMKNFQSDTKDV